MSVGVIMAQPPEPAENRVFEEVYLAKDDGSGNPGDEAAEFAPTDIPIHCVVVLAKASPATVRMDLIAVSVPGVRPGSKPIISTSYTTKDLQDRVFFAGRPEKLWIAGTYRADIFVDGNLVGKYPFVIRATSPPKPAIKSQQKQPVKLRSATAKKT